MSKQFGLFSDINCGFEELCLTDHFCIQMLADKAIVRIMVKKNGLKEKYRLKWILDYPSWMALCTLMTDFKLNERDIVVKNIEYRYLPVGRSVLWINGKEFKFEGTFEEFRRSVSTANKKIIKLRQR